jgi:hypothetical protein
MYSAVEDHRKRFAQIPRHLRQPKFSKSQIFVLVTTLLLVVSFGTQCAKPESESPDPRITVYVVPAITDVNILPTTSMSDSYISNDISIVASPGEYEPASFVIHANEGITSLEVEATSLTGESGSIPSDNVDIRVVKCWYQGGKEIYNPGRPSSQRYLTPELLLKDDTLVQVEGTEWDNPNGQNYLKLTSGEYIWISEADDDYPGMTVIPITERPVKDSSTLQPVDISNGVNKQFWVTVNVPDDSVAGIYTGNIELRTSSELIGELQLALEVLPIELSEPYVDYWVYYRGRLRDSGSISSEDKNEEQFRAEMENIFNHGKTNPTVYLQESGARFEEVLTIRNEAAMDNRPLYYMPGGTTYGIGLSGIVNLAKNSYGVTDVYFYPGDEPGPENLDLLRALCDQYHNAGGKTFTALNAKLSEEEIIGLADVLDLANISPDVYASSVADEYHSYGHRISSYGYPQTHAEFPETYRKNYGLLLWQRDYDAAGTYAYQHSFDDIWNDFDCWVRDHVFAYPTMDGVIDTVQWEGWREGVDDVRYLTTLLDLTEEAKGEGKDTSSVESWLADLKNADLTTKDLDTVRSEMIGHILSLLGEDPSDITPPVITYVAALDITGSSAVITWTTDEQANSQVEYVPTEDLGLSSELETWLVRNHAIPLTSLDTDTTYYFRVKSTDASGNLATSDIYSFNTLSSLSISSIIPTDADHAVVNRDWTEVNTFIDSIYEVSSFIE